MSEHRVVSTVQTSMIHYDSLTVRCLFGSVNSLTVHKSVL